jgi:hypothetical protein
VESPVTKLRLQEPGKLETIQLSFLVDRIHPPQQQATISPFPTAEKLDLAVHWFKGT